MAYGHSKQSHKRIRSGQSFNMDYYHHSAEKVRQLKDFTQYLKGSILEVFAGKGNLTDYYKEFGKVTAMTKDEFGSSFDAIYKLRGERKTFDVIDIDSYGYPDLFFPVVFELMNDECFLVFTFPVVGVNCLNGITEQHFITFWRSIRPTIGDVTGILTDLALRNWYRISLLDISKIRRIWRFAFLCKRVKATEMCNVKNR